MISQIRKKQIEYSFNKTDEDKKILGQYFTDSPIAVFMSSLINVTSLNPNNVKVLDCGAGYGILTVSTAIHLLKNGINKVEATLYEIDNEVINNLTDTLDELKAVFDLEGKLFNYTIINSDFVTTRPDLNSKLKFDISVINPPYFKYSVKDSIYSKKTIDLFKGDPNIYASFIAVAHASLTMNGQIVFISPRSFLNGLYFKGFRKYLLNNSKLDLIHVFKSRKDVFVDSDILQENIIVKMIKNNEEYSKVKISSSIGISDLQNPKTLICSKSIIIDTTNDEKIIRIPESEKDYEVLQKAENLSSTFSQEGYYISTGPVVEHRTQSYLTTIHQGEKAPLFKAHNVLINGIIWDGKNKKDLSFNLKPSFDKHLITNNRYLILKRFTSKDEKRRLVAGVYNPIKNLEYIGISNKLNYIRRKDSLLSEDEALGLSVLFNSEFMDNYYRCISGNTQVNATDIRVMKIPDRAQIVQLGKYAANYPILDYDTIENITKKIFND